MNSNRRFSTILLNAITQSLIVLVTVAAFAPKASAQRAAVSEDRRDTESNGTATKQRALRLAQELTQGAINAEDAISLIANFDDAGVCIIIEALSASAEQTIAAAEALNGIIQSGVFRTRKKIAETLRKQSLSVALAMLAGNTQAHWNLGGDFAMRSVNNAALIAKFAQELVELAEVSERPKQQRVLFQLLRNLTLLDLPNEVASWKSGFADLDPVDKYRVLADAARAAAQAASAQTAKIEQLLITRTLALLDAQGSSDTEFLLLHAGSTYNEVSERAFLLIAERKGEFSTTQRERLINLCAERLLNPQEDAAVVEAVLEALTPQIAKALDFVERCLASPILSNTRKTAVLATLSAEEAGSSGRPGLQRFLLAEISARMGAPSDEITAGLLTAVGAVIVSSEDKQAGQELIGGLAERLLTISKRESNLAIRTEELAALSSLRRLVFALGRDVTPALSQLTSFALARRDDRPAALNIIARNVRNHPETSKAVLAREGSFVALKSLLDSYSVAFDATNSDSLVALVELFRQAEQIDADVRFRLESFYAAAFDGITDDSRAARIELASAVAHALLASVPALEVGGALRNLQPSAGETSLAACSYALASIDHDARRAGLTSYLSHFEDSNYHAPLRLLMTLREQMQRHPEAESAFVSALLDPLIAKYRLTLSVKANTLLAADTKADRDGARRDLEELAWPQSSRIFCKVVLPILRAAPEESANRDTLGELMMNEARRVSGDELSKDLKLEGDAEAFAKALKTVEETLTNLGMSFS